MLRNFRSSLALAVVTLGATSVLPAQSDRPAKGNWQCDTNTGGPTIYATRFFEWNGLADEIQNAFQQYLLTKYGYKDRVSCRMGSPGGPTVAQLDADMKRQHVQFVAQGRKVVDVPWTVTSPGVTVAYICFGVAQRRFGLADSTYVLRSKIFRIQAGSVRELYLDWVGHLKSLHPDWYFQSPGCNLLPADPAGHQGYIERHVAMYERFKPKVTELDWQYRTGAETAVVDSGTAAPAPAPPAAAPAPAPPPPAAPPPATAGKPEVDRFGRPLPALTFYCQYLGMARDASGKYPLYQNELFTIASSTGKVQNAWKAYIESTYHPSAPGSPACASLPSDPAQRAAHIKSVSMLKQTGTQVVVKVNWKP